MAESRRKAISLGAGLPPPPLARPKVTRMRYVTAAMLSVVVIICGMGFCHQVERDCSERLRDWLRMSNGGTLDPMAARLLDETDPAAVTAFYGRLEFNESFKAKLASWLRKWKFVWIAAILGVTFGMASFIAQPSQSQKSEA